jgi:hypothetical protein
MLLCRGPQSLCYDQTRRTSPHLGPRPVKWSPGKEGAGLFIHTLLRIRPKIIFPLPGTGPRKHTFEHFADGEREGAQQKSGYA